MPDGQDFANLMQQRVHRRLGLLGAGPAAFFRDACRLVAGPERLAATTHLVGHLLREVEANLLAVLYEHLVAPPPTVTPGPSPDLRPTPAPAPSEPADDRDESADAVAAHTAEVCPAERDGHRTKVRKVLHALEIEPNDPVARHWIRMAGGEKALHRIAHRDRLNPPRPVTPGFLADFDTIVELLDTVLDRFEARYGTVYARLDSLLARSAPGDDGIRLLREAMPNTARTLGYFFDRLEHVGWLEPLRRAGFFRVLPRVERDAEGKSLFVYWAAGDYLARVASLRPAIVASILDEVGDEPENIRAHAQMIEIMLRLRPEDRVRLAPLVRRWAPALRGLFWGDQVVAFATAMAENGAIDLALEIAAVALGLPEPDPETGRRTPQVAEYGRDRQGRAWDLRDAGPTLIAALRAADGVCSLTLFADALDYQAGRRAKDADAEPGIPEGLDDFSHHWADDLGKRERFETDDLRVFLTQATLSTMQELGEREPAQLESALGVLRSRGARVLRRIEMAALAALVRSENPEVISVALPHALERLLTRALIVENDVAPEWAALLAAAYPQLGEGGRTRVLAAIQPPDFGWMQNEEHRAGRRAAWRRDRLAVIADYLPPAVKAELAALIAAEGDPESLRHDGPRAATWVGPASPVEPAALAAMTSDELIAFLQTWEPREGFAEASPEGLGRQLAKLLEEHPAKYAHLAPRFVGLAPTYVRSFLSGFVAVARAGRGFPWGGLLELAEWVVGRDTSVADLDGAAIDADRGWQEARRTTAGLLKIGLGRNWNDDGVIPLGERERLWRIIAPLAEDPHPSTAYESEYGGTNMDPTTLAINTTRPEAIDAAIRYAYWVAMHEKQSDHGLSRVLDAVPQVAELLARHLEPLEDPSLAVRAAIGQWLGSLARTDPDWVTLHLPLLLPEEEGQRARRDALWDAFVQWTQPHPDVLPVLEPFYRAAVERTGTDRHRRDRGREADDRLAEHIMTLYWWGAIDLDDSDNLVRYLFTRADVDRRKHAIHYTGFSLYHSDKPIHEAPLERLRRLWEWRALQLEVIIASSGNRDEVAGARGELEEFGWWFAAGAFPPMWALPQLHRVLVAVHEIALDHAVAERLAELAATHPAEAVQCLSVVDFTGGAQPWSAHAWLEHAGAVIERGLASEDDAVRTATVGLVNRIVAAGQVEFRRYLREQSG